MHDELANVLEDLVGHMAHAVELLSKGSQSEQAWSKSLKGALDDVRAMAGAAATKKKLDHPSLKHVEVMTETGHRDSP